MVIVKLGYENFIVKEISRLRNLDDYASIEVFFNQVFNKVLLFSLLVTVFIISLSELISNILLGGAEYSYAIIIISLLIYIHSVTYLYSEALKALGFVNASVLSPFILFPLFNIVGTLVLFPIYGLEGVFISVFISAVINYLFVKLFYYKKFNKLKNLRKQDTNNTHSIAKSTIPVSFYVISLANFIFAAIDTFVLGVLSTTSEVGIYSIILRVLLPFSTMLIILNGIFARQFSVLAAEDNVYECHLLYKKLLMLCFSLSVIMFIAIVCYGDSILLFFGKEFVVGYEALVIMTLGSFILLSTGPSAIYLMMAGYEKDYKNLLLLTGITGVLLSFIFIYYFNLIGAAISTSATLALKNILSFYLVRKKCGVRLF
jgi:O-antigen/teichoic acid export membrane protein